MPTLQTLVLETVAACNLRCAHCPCGMGLTPRRTPALMSLELASRVLSQVGHVAECYPALWGEPTLHPQLLDLLALIRPRADGVTLTTNGTAVDARLAIGIARLVDRVLVGVPAATAATYRAVCGADRFDAALDGIKRLVAEAPGRVAWVFVVTSANEREVDAARTLAAGLDVDLRVKSAWLPPGGPLAPAAVASRYAADGVPRVDPLGCRDFWQALQVHSDGTITTCCYDFQSTVIVGDAWTQHVIDDVWYGARYAELRENHLAGQLAGFCQRNCGRAS